MNPIKLSALYHTTKGMGARFVDVAGWRVPHNYGEAVALDEGVALIDASASGKLLVEGAEAAGVMADVWDVGTLAIGSGAEVGSGAVYRLREDRFFVHTVPGGEAAALAALSMAAGEGRATVTDVTHGRAEIQLLGPGGRELLSRLCGLDFSGDSFKNLTAKQTSVAKTRQLLLRHDADARPLFSVIGGRSLAAYVWETMLEAGRDLGVRAAGQDVAG